jgi:hypothetical protein
MTDHPKPSGSELDRARIIYSRDLAMEELLTDPTRTGAGRKGRSISPSRLYAYAVGKPEHSDAGIEEAMEADPTLRAVYYRMVRAAARHSFAPVRAASSEAAPVRQTEDCRIEIGEDDGEIFVLIRLAADSHVPTILTVFGRGDARRRVELPEPLRGMIHFPITHDLDLLDLLRDPASEVFLS